MYCALSPPVPIQKPTKCVCWLLLHRLPQQVMSGERRRVRKTQGALQTRRREAQTAVMKDRLEIYTFLVVMILNSGHDDEFVFWQAGRSRAFYIAKELVDTERA